ncbi:MAG: DUF1552 domain-containing protein, partial [Myxococcaceae bacterium]|nr:DUF1552 domain-containing protein [Myxococcaceae bacterium]
MSPPRVGHLSRRGFLGASALSLFALPFLRGRALGATGAPPVRLVIMTAMNGLVDSTREARFQCTGNDTSLTLAPQFASLEPLKSKVVAFSGLNNMTLASSGFASAGHDPAIMSLLTAVGAPFGTQSVDQFIASQLSTGAPFRNLSVRLCASAKSGFHAPGGAWLPGEQSPQNLLDNTFARLAAPVDAGSPVDLAAVRTRNVLDFVRSQNAALRTQLCGRERESLDAYLDAVERARGATADAGTGVSPPASACRKPGLSFGYDTQAPANMVKVRDAQVETIAMALACQLTPVVSYCLRPDGDAEYYPFLAGVDPGAIFHDYAHGTSQAKSDINGFIVGSFCKLVSRLNEIPEGAGTLLDNTVVMLVSDQRNGGEFSHDTANLPVVLAGGAGGKLKGGRMLAYQGESFHKLLTSLCRLVGVNVTSFGDASLSAGGLARL